MQTFKMRKKIKPFELNKAMILDHGGFEPGFWDYAYWWITLR